MKSPAAYQPYLATAVPRTPEVRFEIAKAIQALAAQDEDERLRQRRATLASLRRELGEIALALQELRRACDPRLRSYVLKYSPDQPRVPAGNPDGGQWTSDDGTPSNVGTHYGALDIVTQTSVSGSDHLSSSDIPAGDPQHPVPLVDSAGNPITDDRGHPLLRPANLPPEIYVNDGLAVKDQFVASMSQESGVLLSLATTRLASELLRFGQGGPWDAQRVHGQFVDDYRDYATITIGLYMAAAGVPIQIALRLQNEYAYVFSNFDPKEPKDEIYTNLPKRNVRNTEIGYELYASGRISAGP